MLAERCLHEGRGSGFGAIGDGGDDILHGVGDGGGAGEGKKDGEGSGDGGGVLRCGGILRAGGKESDGLGCWEWTGD